MEELEILYPLCWTPQEQKMIGSGLPNQKYFDYPHIPLAVQDKIVTVNECNQERQKIGKFLVASECKGKIGIITFTYEFLDTDPNSLTYGQTITDPKPLDFEDLDGNKETLEDKTDAIKFLGYEIPFKRG